MINKLVIALLVIAVSGCASIPEPVIRSSQKQAPSKVVDKPKILLVIDSTLENPYMEGLFFTKEVGIQNSYGKVGAILVSRLAKQGIEADLVLHNQPLPFTLPDGGYSYVLIERLERFNVQSSKRYGDYVSGRLWKASLFDLTDPREHRLILDEVYSSDGVICVQGANIANQVPCKEKYLEYLLSHLMVLKGNN
ncbi:MAG TPA: hypothetical protein VK974_07415 [Methylophilaceae bacterium]|nr:hypothetical protein [Methylophilaceae bacterium]